MIAWNGVSVQQARAATAAARNGQSLALLEREICAGSREVARQGGGGGRWAVEERGEMV